MLDAYKELTPVIYGENAIRHMVFDKKDSGMCFHSHWHDRIELLRVMKGELRLHFGEEQFLVHSGELVIVSPRMIHGGFAGNTGVTYHIIMFDVEKFCNTTIASDKYLRPVCSSEILFAPVTSSPVVISAVDRLLGIISEEEQNPLFAIGAVYEILGALQQHCVSDENQINKADKRFREILEYIGSHFTEPISTRDISRKFGYSEAYFCRRFKAVTGLNVIKYIQILRLELAQRLLRETDEEIGTVSWKCGFSDISYFSNCFKKQFGITPTAFKEMK